MGLIAVLAACTTAIQNARLLENTHHLAVLEERNRLGLDLHDDILQLVTGVCLSLENALHTIAEDSDLATYNSEGQMMIRSTRSAIFVHTSPTCTRFNSVKAV